MKNMDLISRAVKLAALAHKDQERKGGAPYVSHPIIVGFILSQYGFDAETIAAGILHDVIEDTPITKEDIVRDFGGMVAETVSAWSENADLPWIQRKADLVEQIRAANPSAKAVAIADHISNLTDFLADYEQVGPSLWNRWPDRTATDKLAHDEQFLNMLKSTWNHPIIREFEALFEREKAIVQGEK